MRRYAGTPPASLCATFRFCGRAPSVTFAVVDVTMIAITGRMLWWCSRSSAPTISTLRLAALPMGPISDSSPLLPKDRRHIQVLEDVDQPVFAKTEF